MSIGRVVLIGNSALDCVGSGYLLRRDRILTARHVLFKKEENDDPKRVFGVVTREAAQTPGANWTSATVLWSDTDNDVALLEIPKPEDLGNVPAGLAPLGQLPRDISVGGRAIGFPRFKAEGFPNGITNASQRNSLDAKGSVTDYHQIGDFRLTFDISSFGPADNLSNEALDKGISWWGGMSGAAMLHGSYVCGVVIVDASEGLNRSVLQVVPLRLVLANFDFRRHLGLDDRQKWQAKARRDVARVLSNTPRAAALIAALPIIRDVREPGVGDESVALADRLLRCPLPDLLKSLRDVVDDLEEDTQPDGRRLRESIRELAERLAATLHLDWVVDTIRSQRGDPGAVILEIPCAMTMVAEIVMAGADNRKPEFLPKRKDNQFPDGRQLLTSPPESGFGWAAAEEQAKAIRESLTATFAVGHESNLRKSIEDFVFNRFVEEAASRPKTRTDKNRLANARLEALSHRKTFYMVYRMPEDESAREELKRGVRSIGNEFPGLVFLGLSGDTDVEINETRIFGALQTMLPLKE